MTRRTRLPSWLVGSGVIAGAIGIMNLSTYAFTVLAARLLGPAEYGELAAALGVMLVLNVAALGLQATGARRVSTAPEHLERTEREVLWATYRAAVAIGVLGLALVPVLHLLLRLDVAAALLVAVAMVPVTVMGGQSGILQGERRWLPLAAIYTAFGLGRIVAGVATMLVLRDATGAMLGVALGGFVPAVIGWFALRHPGRRPVLTDDLEADPSATPEPAPAGASRGVLAEVLRNSHALLAFFALSNTDILVARSVLDDQQSGLYAGGLILTKAVLFLPQFVVVLVFPSLSAGDDRGGLLRRALGLVLAIGTLATVVAWLLAPLAVLFIGGEAYAALESRVWAFAAVGTLLAMIQLVVYAVVARQLGFGVYVLWAGLAVLLASSVLVDDIDDLLTAVLAVLGAVLVTLTALTRHGSRARGRAEQVPLPS